MVDANFPDFNSFPPNAGQLPTSGGQLASQFQTNAWGDLANWFTHLPGATVQLVQSNSRYLIVLAVMVFVIHQFGLSNYLPATFSIVLSFLIVIALAPVWVPLVPVN